MRSKTFKLDLDTETSAAIARAVASYAQAAYPPGGSECSQVAHETLLDTAKQLHHSQEQSIELRKRQLPLLKAAIKWYFSEHGPEPATDPQQFLSLLQRGNSKQSEHPKKFPEQL